MVVCEVYSLLFFNTEYNSTMLNEIITSRLDDIKLCCTHNYKETLKEKENV